MPIYQNSAPFFDDAQNAIANDYVEILFLPERAVQSRELTQIQSLLQYQVSNLGDFLFKNGSPVTGGHITFDNTVYGVQIQANDAISLGDFNGQLVINTTGPVTTRAIVVAIDDTVSSNTVEGALILKYLSGNEFSNGDSLTISIGVQETATLLPANAVYRASVASMNEGVFYVDGYFIYVPQQTVVLSSTSPTPSVRVGLEIQSGVVDYLTDSSLLDPALGSSNYGAPGADRFQYKLVLSTRTLNSVDDSEFFELLRIENGIIVNQVEYPVLGAIENALAQRTYDADGNFTVDPFIVTAVDDTTDANSFILDISPGKAYVDGYEFQTIVPVKINESKARSTNTSNDYFLSLEFGNYFTVTNLNSGNTVGFNTGNFGELDVHIVPSANINVANVQAYSNTKMGTARVRDIEFDGANTWLAYALNISLPPLTVNANAVSVNTTMVYFPPTFTNSPNAIANVAMTVVAGNSAGDVRTIVSYDSTTKIGYLNRPTTQLLDTTSELSLQFGTKDINSLVATPAIGIGNVFATQNASAGLYACMDISVNGGKDAIGNTILFDTNYNMLVYPLPQSFIAQNSFSDVSFMNRKTLSTVTFTGGNTTIATGSGLDNNEVFTFGLTGAYLPDTVAQQNFFVVVRNSQTGNIANGQPIIWDLGSNPAGNGVYQTDSTSVTIKTSTTGNFIADILITVQDQNASVNFRRSKTLIGNTSNNSLTTTDSYLNGLAVIGTVNANSVYLDTSNGMIWFTNWNDIPKIPGVVQSLYLPDVIQIIKVFDSGNPNYAPNTNNAIDITSNYLFDSGQRDNYYDYASIILQGGASPPSGQTVVMVQYYAQDSTSGFFSADSYSANNYARDLIPIYNSQKFGTVYLRDSIDFRPTRNIGTTANVQTLTINGLRLPQPDDSMQLSYSYYIGRYDKLVLTKNRQFTIISGIPALNPELPADQPESMSLYNILIPPYTYYASNVTMEYVENKRYTMKDIGSLDSRITQLEYYATLTQLEQQASNTKVLYQDGTTAKEQYGILTDAFVDFSVADTTSPGFLCYINGGMMTPFQSVTTVEFKLTSNTGPYNSNGVTSQLQFTEEPAVIQNTASDYTQIQPYAFGQFNGEVVLKPQSDIFYSQDLIPAVIGVVEIPPIHVTPIAPPASNIGLSSPSGTNPANLTPATTTSNTVPSSSPVVGSAAPANNSSTIIYRIPFYGWFYGYNLISQFYQGSSELSSPYLNNKYYYGKLDLTLEKTASGWGMMSATGNWFPIPQAAAASVFSRAGMDLPGLTPAYQPIINRTFLPSSILRRNALMRF